MRNHVRSNFMLLLPVGLVLGGCSDLHRDCAWTKTCESLDTTGRASAGTTSGFGGAAGKGTAGGNSMPYGGIAGTAANAGAAGSATGGTAGTAGTLVLMGNVDAGSTAGTAGQAGNPAQAGTAGAAPLMKAVIGSVPESTIRVTLGQISTIILTVNRVGLVTGTIRVQVQDLPTSVTASEVDIPAGSSTAQVQIQARSSAKVGGPYPFKIIAESIQYPGTYATIPLTLYVNATGNLGVAGNAGWTNVGSAGVAGRWANNGGASNT